MTIDGLAVGVAARIIAVDWSALAIDEAKRLQALGFDEGVELSIAHRGVMAGRDPIALRVGNMTIAIRRSHARAIAVETVSSVR
jgi:ferrous iron transport protein A